MSVVAQVVKKFINDPENVVPEALAGVAAAHPGLLKVDLENQLVLRAEAPVAGKVGLVSGGGSGHEPLHGGLVGLGMLDAACAGAVFTSPVPDQMAAATRAVDGGSGVLHIVKNYTGDVLNFRMAAELAEDEGLRVESVVIDDDVAVQDSLYTAGRRGVGATVLAFVNGLGGTPLLELYLLFNEVAQQLSARGVSIGRSLVGNYITSLEMAGASITLLELDDQLTALWDAPVKTAALRWGV